MRLLLLTLTLGTSFAGLQSCLRHAKGPESQVLTSGVGEVEVVVQTFKKFIGRDPGPAEIAALRSLSYPDLVTALLKSQQFDQEGFFNLQRERLLLNREGSRSWVKNTYYDYCALRLEMSEQAAQDREGVNGYFSILRYRERWVPLASFNLDSCFMGTDIASILKAKDLIDQQQDASDSSPSMQQAMNCAQRIPFSLGADDPGMTDEQRTAQVEQFWKDLKAIPAPDRKKNFVFTPTGERLFLTGLKNSIVPTYGNQAEGARPYKDYEFDFVKKDQAPIFLRELGTQAPQQCLFTPLDLATFVPPEFGNSGFALAESNMPTSFSSPVGLPEQPTLLPSLTGLQNPELQARLTKADGPVYVKIKMPIEMEGLHASPYWLSRHTSKTKNRNLHRARLIYFSYLCADINPDAANFSGGAVSEFPPLLKPYFAADDTHTKGSQNCYNCHTKVQPIANFFGQSSFGSTFESDDDDDNDNDDDDDNDLPATVSTPQFVNSEDPFYRPGGIFDGEKFFPTEGSKYGMEGLANVLSVYPEARRCIVDSTWAALVGREYPLTDTERAAATAAFSAGGTPRLASLVKHFALDNKRGATYFEKGEAAMTQITEQSAFVCPDPAPEAMAKSAKSTLEGPCVDCHSGQFIDNNNKFNFDNYFLEGNDDDTPEARGNLWHRLTCKIKTGTMPPLGSGISLTVQKRQDLWCYLSRERDHLAAAGKIPTAFNGKKCNGETVQSVQSAPHELHGNEGAAQ